MFEKEIEIEKTYFDEEEKKIKTEISYIKGSFIRHGNTIFYYENGNKNFEMNYKNDKSDGRFISYYETGKVKREGIYKDGQMHDVWKTYYEDGKIRIEEFFRDDNKNFSKEYYPNGNIKGFVTFRESGMLHGILITWHEDGKLNQMEFYNNGNLGRPKK